MLMGIASLKDSINTGQSLSADGQILNTDRHRNPLYYYYYSLKVDSLNTDGQPQY